MEHVQLLILHWQFARQPDGNLLGVSYDFNSLIECNRNFRTLRFVKGSLYVLYFDPGTRACRVILPEPT